MRSSFLPRPASPPVRSRRPSSRSGRRSSKRIERAQIAGDIQARIDARTDCRQWLNAVLTDRQRAPVRYAVRVRELAAAESVACPRRRCKGRAVVVLRAVRPSGVPVLWSTGVRHPRESTAVERCGAGLPEQADAITDAVRHAVEQCCSRSNFIDGWFPTAGRSGAEDGLPAHHRGPTRARPPTDSAVAGP